MLFLSDSLVSLESRIYFYSCEISLSFSLFPPNLQVMESSGTPSVTLIVGSGLSCLALITLAVVYAALWRYVVNE